MRRYGSAMDATATRVSQRDRIDAMRGKLLDATVECLCASGYSGMSTNQVVRTAGVSRGALAHHFPTKADLVAAAAESLVDRWADQFRARFGGLTPDQRTPEVALDVLWSMYEEPGFVALIELTVAARSDPDLRSVLSGSPDRIADITKSVFAEFFPDLARVPFVDEALRAVLALYTGLAVQTFIDADDHGRHAAVRRLLTTLLTTVRMKP